MDAYATIVTVFVSGIFSLLVSMVTEWLSHRKESRKQQVVTRREQRLELQSLYIDTLSQFERGMRHVVDATDISELLKGEFSVNHAKIALLSTEQILTQTETLGDAIQAWSKHVRSRAPLPISGTTMSIVKIPSPATADKEGECLERVNNEMKKMLRMMQEHLSGCGIE